MEENYNNIIKKCCAVTYENKRCNKQTIYSSYHCSEHYDKAKKLYKKYKKICSKAYNLDLNKNYSNDQKREKYLLKCYNLFSKAYKARKNHRKYAFVEECHDYGHNLQFKILKKKMELCESLLGEIYIRNRKETDNNLMDYLRQTKGFIYKSFDEGKKNKKSQKIVVVKKCNKSNKRTNKISTIKIKQRKEEEAIKMMDEYIAEKEEELKQTMKLVNLIVKIMNDIVKPFFRNYDNLYKVYIMLFHLVSRLDNIDYFNDFVPEICKECNCGSYAVYDLVLMCECSLYHYEIEEYLCTIDRSVLRKFYEDLLYNKNKISQVFADTVLYFKLYGNTLINNGFELTWDNDKKRLIVQPAPYYEYEKYSKILATQRLKKKHFMKKYEEDGYISTDSDSSDESDMDELESDCD